MASKKLLELLNKGIAREIQVSVQYMWQHVQWSGIPHYAVKDELKKAAIAEIQIDTSPDGKQRVKVKLHDKRAALMDIGKHLGMFREKIEVSGPNGGAIEVKNKLEVSLLDKEERDMLKQMLLAIAERKAEREAGMRVVNAPMIDYDDA